MHTGHTGHQLGHQQRAYGPSAYTLRIRMPNTWAGFLGASLLRFFSAPECVRRKRRKRGKERTRKREKEGTREEREEEKNAAEGRKANGCRLCGRRGGREQGGGDKKTRTMERGPREFSLAQVTDELHRAACLGEACHTPIPTGSSVLEGGVGSDPDPARHVLTTLRVEARTLYTASACHAWTQQRRQGRPQPRHGVTGNRGRCHHWSAPAAPP